MISSYFLPPSQFMPVIRILYFYFKYDNLCLAKSELTHGERKQCDQRKNLKINWH